MASYITKEKLKEWIFENYPSHFLTIQFPRNYRSENYYISVELLRKMMSRFEYHLLQSRYWNKKHVPFIAIAEKGRSYNWHFHVLINLAGYNLTDISEAKQQALKDMKMSLEVIHIIPFTHHGESYSTKEIEINLPFYRQFHTTAECL